MTGAGAGEGAVLGWLKRSPLRRQDLSSFFQSKRKLRSRGAKFDVFYHDRILDMSNLLPFKFL